MQCFNATLIMTPESFYKEINALLRRNS